METTIFKKSSFWVPVLAFNVALIGLHLIIANNQDEIALAKEGVKAIAWTITAPMCEIRNFCYKITRDETGLFKSSIVKFEENVTNVIYTSVETTIGTYVIEGSIVNTYKEGLPVSLYVEKAGVKNVLCISTDCFVVPYNKRA